MGIILRKYNIDFVILRIYRAHRSKYKAKSRNLNENFHNLEPEICFERKIGDTLTLEHYPTLT